MTDNNISVWDSDVVKSFEQEGSGGGGWICYTNIQLGYKVFASGYSNEETFFPFNISDENDKKRAKLESQKFVDGVNSKLLASDDRVKPATNAIRIEVDKAQVYNKDTSTWQGNRIQDTPVWTDAYKQIIFPHLKEANADLGWQWARISFAPDPYKPTRINQLTGDEVANLVMYVAETYLTKAEALDAAATLAKVSADSIPEAASGTMAHHEAKITDVPAGWDLDSWESVIPEIKKEIESGKSLKEIADDYGVSVPDIVKLK